MSLLLAAFSWHQSVKNKTELRVSAHSRRKDATMNPTGLRVTSRAGQMTSAWLPKGQKQTGFTTSSQLVWRSSFYLQENGNFKESVSSYRISVGNEVRRRTTNGIGHDTGHVLQTEMPIITVIVMNINMVGECKKCVPFTVRSNDIIKNEYNIIVGHIILQHLNKVA